MSFISFIQYFCLSAFAQRTRLVFHLLHLKTDMCSRYSEPEHHPQVISCEEAIRVSQIQP